MTNNRLHPGDLVEVLSADQILRTLDAEGTLDHLPFMPEMVEFCGKRFTVSKRVLKTCFSGTYSSILRFRTDEHCSKLLRIASSRYQAT